MTNTQRVIGKGGNGPSHLSSKPRIYQDTWEKVRSQWGYARHNQPVKKELTIPEQKTPASS